MSDTDIVSIEPATGAELFRAAPGDVPGTLARARRAFANWAAQPLANRVELLRRFVNEVRKDAEELAKICAREVGKPLWEATAEVEALTGRVEIAARAYSERCAQRKLDNGINGTLAVRHKPHGVAVVISPFSQPLLAPAGQIVPALLAGNAVVWKPSEKAPASAERLLQCFVAAGLPSTVIQVVHGTGAEAIALATADGVDAVHYSGSAQAGIALNRKLAARPDRLVALDMGGNNPLVVWDTPKIHDAALLAVQSAFAGAGQRPTAARRLIVASSLYDPFIEELRSLTGRLICGAPFDDPAPYMGPVIDNRAADGLAESMIWLMSNGGRPIRHMARLHESLPFVSPGIVDVTAIAERPDVELFGPLLQVIRVDTLEQAIAEANRTRYGLAAGLIGGSPQDYNRFWTHVRAGLVSWNRALTADLPAAPLGGVGLSGNHRPGAWYAADRCAFPVTSLELEQPRAALGTGFAAT